MQYVATFYTHFAAQSFLQGLGPAGLCGRMMPTPRKLSASCGVSVAFEAEGDFRALLVEDTEAVYAVSQGGYILQYHNDSETAT